MVFVSLAAALITPSMVQKPSFKLWGYFFDNVNITGDLTKGNGSFLLIIPLIRKRPLWHTFVESAENLLIYRGKTEFDGNGEVVVQLPDYSHHSYKDEATIYLTPKERPFLRGA